MWFNLTDDEQALVQHHLRSTTGDQDSNPVAIALADRLRDDAVPGEHDHLYRDAAGDPFGETQIDGDAVVSVGEGGASVMAWVYVTDEEAEIPDEDDEEDEAEGSSDD